MGLEYNVKFPCGYELSLKVKAELFSVSSTSFDEKEFKECPLHGKNCPPMMRTKKSSHNYKKGQKAKKEKPQK